MASAFVKLGISERAGSVWIKLYNAQEEHGKDSAEYHRALKEWVRFLRAESHSTKSKIERSSKDLREAWKNLCEAKNDHGVNSAQFKLAERELGEIKLKVNRMVEEINPIFRAVMSL